MKANFVVLVMPKENIKKQTTKTKDRTLVIFDAHAIIHRAYHALPSFSMSDGTPTGALYGLSAMLIRIIEELDPDYVVAAYDLPKPTFRHHAYEAYKGTRAKTDDELKIQLAKSREIFEAFGVPCLDAEGFEADDVVGTVVEKLKKEKNLRIIIASGDMDTLQLVEGKRVQVYTLKKGITDTALYDEAAVLERYGFDPIHLIDYKGLRGDPSDNIIGVPGIGEKTATAIIQTFGTIETLYEKLEKNKENGKTAGLSPRVIDLLLEHKDDAFFSKTLATIRRNAPVNFILPEGVHKMELNTEKLMEVLYAYEFRSLVPRVRNLFKLKNETPIAEGEVDEALLHQASIASWLLYSEDTTPTLETILSRTKKKTLPEAFEALIEELKKRNLFTLFEKVELPLIPLVKSMQERGILIDRKHFLSLKETMSTKLRAIETEVEKCTGAKVNLNSPKQLSELLFTTLGLKAKGKRKASGSFSTNAETLTELRDAHPVVPLLLEYREVQKLLTTYVEALLIHAKEDGRVHAQFLQHGTTTGRFSSANPNLQNIPNKGEGGKDIRKGFIASPGNVFIACDYSQIELRILAILSGDEELIKTFKRGDDIHSSVASRMFNLPIANVTKDMRRIAKVINFGILFGMGVSALSKNLGTERKEAQQFYNNYFETFPSVAKYIEETKEKARTLGYTETYFGRRRYFPQINAGAPFLRAFAERMASNAPIQGTEADILKIAMLLVDEDIKKAKLDSKVHLLLQIHDELVYEVETQEVERAKEIIESAMVAAYTRSPIKVAVPVVPLTVSVGSGGNLADIQ